MALIVFKHFPNSLPGGSSPLTILIGGDVMFDRNIRILGDKHGYESLFASSTSLFKSADITVVNLEGPITRAPSETYAEGVMTGSFTFTFATTTARAMRNSGITLASLANNHANNFGRDGYVETQDWLYLSGINWFGNPWNDPGQEYTVIKNGVRVAFVGYHAFAPGIENILADIKRLSSDGYFVIVMPHWGPEYETTATDKMRAQAKQFATAGAKAIVGSHPHVIMDHEWIEGVPVFYSLGNLLFDQYFSKEVMKGNMVELTLTKNAGSTHIEKLRIFETSTASRKGVSVDLLHPETVEKPL
jgi:poly-gamma-glutamate synthesis protein (capsule biosynthesis protein)